MRRSLPVLATLALALLAASGCGPSLRQLIEERSFPDAMCLAEKQHLDAAGRRGLLRAMAASSGQAIQVDVIQPETIRRVLGQQAAELLRNRVIVRLAYSLPILGSAANGLEGHDEWLGRGPSYSSVRVLEREVGLELLAEGRPLPSEPLDRPHLLALTGEHAPPPHVRVSGGGGGGGWGALGQILGVIALPFELVGVVAGAAVNVAVGVATLGTARSVNLLPGYQPMQVAQGLLSGSSSSGGSAHTYEEEAPAAEYRKVAPVAQALHESAEGCGPQPERFLGPERWHGCVMALIERPATEARVPLVARLRWGYVLGVRTDARCRLRDEIEVPLPPGATPMMTIEERLQRGLGGGPRRLADLLAAQTGR